MTDLSKDFLKLGGTVESKNAPFGTHVTTTDGTILIASDVFSCVFSLLGTTYIGDIPDLSSSATLKDIWPSDEEEQTQKQKLEPSKESNIRQKNLKKTRSFWNALDQENVPLTDIVHAYPLPIFRHHDLTFSLLSRGPIPWRNNEPFEAYRGHTRYLKESVKQIVKKHVPQASEAFLEGDTPLVIFGGHAYGRAGDWAWIDRALSLLNVKAVIAHSFDPIVHRALLKSGILPLHWIPPTGADHILLEGDEQVTITGVSTALKDNHTLTMRIQRETHTLFVPLILQHTPESMTQRNCVQEEHVQSF